MTYDYLIIGAGLTGAVLARELTDAGKTCLVVEKRPHIGGNLYTERLHGIDVHCYGAHIFHTNQKAVWQYVNRFADFQPFINSPIANFKGALYNLPFNMNTFHTLWGVTTPQEAERKIESERVPCDQPQNLQEQALALVGRTIYETLIQGYTQKQWGRACTALPASIIKRIPLRFTYDNNYFNDRYQGIPQDGYTAFIQQLLTGIPVQCGVDYLQNKSAFSGDTVLFTGCMDAYFHYVYGALAYRSVRFETKTFPYANHQGVAVMNFTDSQTPYTRSIEHKHFAHGTQEKTVVSYEYSQEWQVGEEPYYPLGDATNQALYARYCELAKTEPQVHFCGRLGSYRYWDMDICVANALQLAKELLA